MASVDTGLGAAGVRPLEPVEVRFPAVNYANPAVLGLLGYGMSTVLLSLANANVFGLGTMVLAMAVFFGGLAQMIVAILSFRRGETFAVTAFGGYAFLWLTLAFLMIGQEHRWWPTQNSTTAMGWYLLIWAIFSLGMMLGSLVAPRVLTGVLALTVVLLTMLAIANWADSTGWTKAAGWEGVLTGASAIYTAFGFLLNEVLGRTVLPVGAPFMKAAA